MSAQDGDVGDVGHAINNYFDLRATVGDGDVIHKLDGAIANLSERNDLKADMKS